MTDCIRSTDRPVLLLLPGMMCDERLWQHQINHFSKSHQVIVAEISGANTVAEIASRVLLKAPARFSLAGLSMGGIVAMEMWRQAPERIERLALLDTNHHADAPEKFMIRHRQMEAVTLGRLLDVMREELKPNYLAACHRNNSQLLDEVLTMGIDQGEEVFVQQSLALRDRIDSGPTLKTISCPTLVLCGEEDLLCPVSVHQYMADNIPSAKLEVIEDCGHLATMEQPEQVNQAMQQWLLAG